MYFLFEIVAKKISPLSALCMDGLMTDRNNLNEKRIAFKNILLIINNRTTRKSEYEGVNFLTSETYTFFIN